MLKVMIVKIIVERDTPIETLFSFFLLPVFIKEKNIELMSREIETNVTKLFILTILLFY